MNVSRETQDKLDQYLALLKKWQKAVNLVSNKTLDDAETRHFDDSLQLVQYIPAGTKTLFDLGSGGGFPGMVIGVACPEIDIHLVESDQKKCSFLKNVSRETLSPVSVHSQRIEVFSGESGIVPDVVTARALASLEKLLSFVLPWAQRNPDLTLLFQKGENAAAEIKEAQALYGFDYISHPSATSAQSCILEIRNIVNK